MFAAGIVGLILSSPTIYAIVEPHITITMDPAQTTNPFQINDDQAEAVFAIDSNGVIISTGAPIQLLYEADGPINIPSGIEFPAQIFLAKWEITKPVGALDTEILVFSNTNQAEMRRTSGIDSTFYTVLVSPDDVIYNTQEGLGTSSDTYEAVFDGFASLDGYPSNTRFIAIGVSNGDATTSGEIQNVKTYLEIMLPHGWTIERVL